MFLLSTERTAAACRVQAAVTVGISRHGDLPLIRSVPSQSASLTLAGATSFMNSHVKRNRTQTRLRLYLTCMTFCFSLLCARSRPFSFGFAPTNSAGVGSHGQTEFFFWLGGGGYYCSEPQKQGWERNGSQLNFWKSICYSGFFNANKRNVCFPGNC